MAGRESLFEVVVQQQLVGRGEIGTDHPAISDPEPVEDCLVEPASLAASSSLVRLVSVGQEPDDVRKSSLIDLDCRRCGLQVDLGLCPPEGDPGLLSLEKVERDRVFVMSSEQPLTLAGKPSERGLGLLALPFLVGVLRVERSRGDLPDLLRVRPRDCHGAPVFGDCILDVRYLDGALLAAVLFDGSAEAVEVSVLVSVAILNYLHTQAGTALSAVDAALEIVRMLPRLDPTLVAVCAYFLGAVPQGFADKRVVSAGVLHSFEDDDANVIAILQN